MPMTWNVARRAAAALLAVSLAPPALAAGAGVQWEQTFAVEMDGMAMPAQTRRVCIADGEAPTPPAGPDEDCRVSDLRRSGHRMTWKVVCTGDEPMTGEGDMTLAPDSWKGTVTLRSPDGPMKVSLRGRKLGGACDPAKEGAALERRGADARRRALAATADAEAATCDAAVGSMTAYLVTGKDAICQDRSALGRLCARIDTRDGFAQLGHLEEGARRQTLAACKRDLESARRRICKASMDDAPEKDAVDFLGRHCPEEVGRLAKRECAGRDFTGLDREWVPFCSRHAKELMAAEAAKKEGKKAASDAAASTGKKAIRGLLGF